MDKKMRCFQRKVELILDERKLFLLKNNSYGSMFSPDKGDVQRFFIPQFSKRRGEMEVGGIIGMHLPKFEDFYNKNYKDDEEGMVFAISTSNAYQLIKIQYFKEIVYSDISKWIYKICNVIDEFPNNIIDLRAQILSGYIGQFDLWKLTLNSSKSKIAIDWIVDSYDAPTS